MLQDQIALRFADETCTCVNCKLREGLTTLMMLTAVVESLAVTTSKGVGTGGELHAGDTSQLNHL